MPRTQNRSVKNKLKYSSDYLLERESGNVFNNNTPPDRFCFEEAVIDECNHSNAFLKSKVNIERLVDYDKSSSSSLSWEDDIDSEATQRVQNEFERMVQVLEGHIPIPSHYDYDEYMQWITIFPHLSIEGKKVKINYLKQPKQNVEDTEEIIVADVPEFTKQSCDKFIKFRRHKSQIVKDTVIDHVFQNVTRRICRSPSKKSIETSPLNKMKMINNIKRETEIYCMERNLEMNLRKSPIQPLCRSPQLNQVTDNKPTNSIVRSEFLSSKWLSDEYQGFLSLPFINTEQPVSAKSHKSTDGKSRLFKRVQNNSKHSPSREKKANFLPPIQNLNLTGMQYRSVSATPRQNNKAASAVSLKLNALLTNKNTRTEVADYLMQNHEKKVKSYKNSNAFSQNDKRYL